MKIEYKKVPVIDGKAYSTEEEAVVSEIQSMFAESKSWTPEAISVQIMNHSGQIIDLLAMLPPIKEAPEYTDGDYENAAEESGIPVKILKSRVKAGKTLNEARTMPYTKRTRASKAAVNAALQDMNQ